MTIERVKWTIHAEERLPQRELTRALVERAVRELHPLRGANYGAAEWRVDAGRFVVVYDYPDGGDLDAVRIVSVWSKRRRKRRSVARYPRWR
jgi:hypothetical protein